MKEKKEKEIIWPIRLKESLKNEFKEFCDKNGYSMTKRLRALMEMDIKK